MTDRCIQLLKDLVQVDSVNPSLVLGARGEDHIARALTVAIQGGIGLRVREQIVSPGRPNIVAELESSFRIHRELGSWLGGVHFELTGEDVTECTGGARGLTDTDLARAYKSQVDPRLNQEQAMELAMRISELHSTARLRR